MDEEPAAHDEDECGRIGDRLQQHPEADAQVQGAKQQEGCGARCTAHEEELKERDSSAYHQQPCDQLVQGQVLEEQGHQNGYHTYNAEHSTVDGVVQGQPLQVLICYLKQHKWCTTSPNQNHYSLAETKPKPKKYPSILQHNRNQFKIFKNQNFKQSTILKTRFHMADTYSRG